MHFKKGMRIHFVSSNRDEIVVKGSSNPVMGMVKTDREEYSCDFLLRYIRNGFAKIYDKKNVEIVWQEPEYMP